jgi:hypothetical protein
MKWAPELESRLQDLCFEGESNAQIAVALGCKPTDVYAARSRLGITIAKVAAAKGETKTTPPAATGSAPPAFITSGFARMREGLVRRSTQGGLSARDTKALKETEKELRKMEDRIALIWL